MRNFKASQATFICEDCGDELKVVQSDFAAEDNAWWVDLECRQCGPYGRERLEEPGTMNTNI